MDVYPTDASNGQPHIITVQQVRKPPRSPDGEESDLPPVVHVRKQIAGASCPSRTRLS